MTKRGLLERIDAGEAVIHASGYLFEMERRGYLQAGGFVPEVVLEHPEVVEQLTREFARCGADVLLAFTYYGHREKMRLIGKEDLLEPLNREALNIAHKVGKEFPDKLIAGNICNTNIYHPDDKDSQKQIHQIFEEQIGWIAEAGVDLVVGETFDSISEVEIAVKIAKEAGVPLVIGTVLHRTAKHFRDSENYFVDDLKRVKDLGADIVGLNCHFGPQTMLPLLKEVTTHITDGRVAGFPVAYRTTPTQPSFGNMRDRELCCPERLPVEGISFPVALDPFTVTRYEMAEFAEEAVKAGALYIGTCCGGAPHHVRAMAESLGRTTEASKYSPDMSKHAFYGDDESLKDYNKNFAENF
ncbi:MAG: homocysteine S-methyltransferase family protein [Alphaproteobacteria bacterium]|nr:homocysteine S-methyltransferase family protein [Alphaproteobacteria bacterium]